MSKSIHTTYRALSGLTKMALEKQVNDPESDLAILARKRSVKKNVIKSRKAARQILKIRMV